MLSPMSLTVVTVNYKSNTFLYHNISLIRSHTSDVKWVIVDNDKTRLKVPGAKIIDGVDNNGMRASMHHAIALNLAVQKLIKPSRSSKSRFVLFLDPDFFILQPLAPIIAHMLNESLAFFGAGYPGYQDWVYSGFPAAFCMLVDTNKVKLDTLDFLPQFDRKTTDVLKPETGFRIYQRYNSMKSEIVQYVGHGPYRDPEEVAAAQKQDFDRYEYNGAPFAIHKHMRAQDGNDLKVVADELYDVCKLTSASGWQ